MIIIFIVMGILAVFISFKLYTSIKTVKIKKSCGFEYLRENISVIQNSEKLYKTYGYISYRSVNQHWHPKTRARVYIRKDGIVIKTNLAAKIGFHYNAIHTIAIDKGRGEIVNSEEIGSISYPMIELSLYACENAKSYIVVIIEEVKEMLDCVLESYSGKVIRHDLDQ